MKQERITRIFQKIEVNEAFKRMFFKKLSETENPYPWFEELRKRGYLEPANNKNPVLEGNNYTVPYWQVLGFLENLARRLSEKPDESLLKKLTALVDSIIEYKENNQRVKNPYTDWMIIKTIFKLPVEEITDKNIQFIETVLLSNYSNSILISAEIEKTVFPCLIDGKSKTLLLKLLQIIIKPKNKEAPLLIEKTSIMDEYWFSEALRKNRLKIVEICGLDTAELIINQMTSILSEGDRPFNVVSIPTIEDSSQTMFPEKYESQLVYLLRETLEQATPPSQQAILIKLLQSEFSIFRRIGIHIINFRYAAFTNFFWSWKENPLEEFGLKHEIYELLKSHHQNFSEKEFGRLVEWIEGIKCKPSKTISEDSDVLQKIEARVKLEWLSAVGETTNKQIKELFQKYSQIWSSRIEHPGYIFWSSGVQVSSLADSRPFSKELLAKSNQEIAEYIINYGKTEERKPFEYAQSFRYSLSRTVRENSQKFATDMKPFLALEYEYQEALLSGLLEAWNNEENVPWDELIDYILELISRVDFWDSSGENEGRYKTLVISNVADLIHSGTNNDKHAYDVKHFPKTEEILLILGEKTKSEVDQTTEDLFTAVLNSSLGSVYSAMISYSLRIARLLKKDVEQKWIKNIQDHFEKTLETRRSVEIDVTLGKFLLQLHFLDKKWVKDNINKIFPKEKTESWINGFSSYLFHSSHFSDELYCLLKANQDYELALKTDFGRSLIFGKISQHIFIAYIRGSETLSEESLMSDLISNPNLAFLSDLVLFAWRLGNKTDKIKPKIKPLWEKIVKFIRSSEDEARYREILAYLSYWLSLVDKIDEDIVDWLKTSIKYFDQKTELFLVEYLLQHVNETPQFVAELFYEIVGVRKFFPQFKQENIVTLVEKLFEYGQTEKAKRICNLYLQNGYGFLRELQEKYKDN